MSSELHSKEDGAKLMAAFNAQLQYSSYVQYTFCPKTGSIFSMIPWCRAIYIPEESVDRVSTIRLVITKLWRPVYDSEFNYLGYIADGSTEHTEWP